MADLKVIEGGAAKSKVGPAVRGALLLLVLEYFGAFIFGGAWSLLAAPKIEALLYGAQLPNLVLTLTQMLMVSVLPFLFALLAVLAPLFGWWVYSRVPADKQNGTGWAMAAIFAAAQSVIGTLQTIGSVPLQDTFSAIAYAFGAVLSFVMLTLWVMFFMGVGFLIAKLFRSKL